MPGKEAEKLAALLNIPKTRAIEAAIKAKLIKAVQQELKRTGFTHQQLADRAGLARTSVTGILSGSLQRITIDRVLKLVYAAGFEMDIKLKRAA